MLRSNFLLMICTERSKETNMFTDQVDITTLMINHTQPFL